ncbi:hypothetical protein FRB98_009541 [Tulasnella sp. 332]|nr:hypothetical protein FRB98_009541 [Tulasnella sp. 332]
MGYNELMRIRKVLQDILYEYEVLWDDESSSQSVRLLRNARVMFTPILDAYEDEEDEEEYVLVGDDARFVGSTLAFALLRRLETGRRVLDERMFAEGRQSMSDVADVDRLCGLKMVRRSLKMEKYS